MFRSAATDYNRPELSESGYQPHFDRERSRYAKYRATRYRIQGQGLFLKDHLHNRLGKFGGQRDATGHNSLRPAGYLQFQLLQPSERQSVPGRYVRQAEDFGG